MGKGSNRHKGGKCRGKGGKSKSGKGKHGYNPHLMQQRDGEMRLVCFSDGAASRGQAGSCLHVTTYASERASRNNVADAAAVRGSQTPPVIVSAGWWELVSIHSSLELVQNWQRGTQRPWNDLVVSLYNDSVVCMEFLAEERLPEDAGAPHLAGIVALVRSEIADLRSRGATVVLRQCSRWLAGMGRAHAVAQSNDFQRPEYYTPAYQEAWRQLQAVYWNAPASDREAMDRF